MDRLALSSPRLRDELVQESFVPFDVPFCSFSNSSLPALFGDASVDSDRLPAPTPLHDPAPTAGFLDF